MTKKRSLVQWYVPFGVLFLVVIAKVVFNELSNPYGWSDTKWLAWDYSWRVLLLVIIFAFPTLRTCAAASFRGLRRPHDPKGAVVFRVILTVFLVVIADFIFTVVARPLLQGVFPDSNLVDFPAITSEFLIFFDLTFGLLLVAVNEELIFRTILRSFLETLTRNKAVIVVASSVCFGLAHWSLGAPWMIATSLTGVLLMVVYLKMGSVVPCIIAHYAINLHWFYARYYPDTALPV